MKVTYEVIEKLMKENYVGTDIEIAALCSDINTLADLIAAKGYDRSLAATVQALINGGKSEEDALACIAK